MYPGPPDSFLQPVKSATFHKTTSAKKISTNEFKQAEFEDMINSPHKSLKYESIVTLPHQSPNNVLSMPVQVPVDSFMTSSSSEVHHLSDMSFVEPNLLPEKMTSTPLQPSPYVYRHRQDDNFVTHLNTEDYVGTGPQSPKTLNHQALDTVAVSMSALSVSDQSKHQDRSVSLSTFQRPQKPPSYQPPPSSIPQSVPTLSLYQPVETSIYQQPSSYQPQLPSSAQLQHSQQLPPYQTSQQIPMSTYYPQSPTKPSTYQPIAIPTSTYPSSHFPADHHLKGNPSQAASSCQPLSPATFQPQPLKHQPPGRDQAAGKEDIKVIHFGIV